MDPNKNIWQIKVFISANVAFTESKCNGVEDCPESINSIRMSPTCCRSRRVLACLTGQPPSICLNKVSYFMLFLSGQVQARAPWQRAGRRLDSGSGLNGLGHFNGEVGAKFEKQHGSTRPSICTERTLQSVVCIVLPSAFIGLRQHTAKPFSGRWLVSMSDTLVFLWTISPKKRTATTDWPPCGEFTKMLKTFSVGPTWPNGGTKTLSPFH